MDFKDIKGWIDKARGGLSGGSSQPEELTIDDLVTLERYEEALAALRKHLKRNKDDLRMRQRLADVLAKTGNRTEAVEEYLSVADSYARDGFYDKARALLRTIGRRFPGLPQVELRLERLQRTRRLDELRQSIVDSLPVTTGMRIGQLWKHIVQGNLVERLSEKQLTRILSALRLVDLDEGQRLVAAGESREELWWIVDGEVSAKHETVAGARTELRAFGRGDVIGERALLERQPWLAGYVAAKKTSALVLDREALAKLLQGEEDPRGFLDALRADRNDEAIVEIVQKMASRD